jgi:hypothetical protein
MAGLGVEEGEQEGVLARGVKNLAVPPWLWRPLNPLELQGDEREEEEAERGRGGGGGGGGSG